MRTTLFCTLGWLLWASTAHADIHVHAKTKLMEGQAATIKVSDKKKQPVSGAQLVAVYAPNSTVAQTVEVPGTTDSGGLLKWTPRAAGLVELKARLKVKVPLYASKVYKWMVAHFPFDMLEVKASLDKNRGHKKGEPVQKILEYKKFVYKKLGKATVSVRYKSMPLSGLLVFVLAGLLLFGGMAFGYRRAFASND